MTTVLRGAISFHPGYFRVTLRVALEGPATPIGEEMYARCARSTAPGAPRDTAYFGSAASAASGRWQLMPNVRDTVGEWYPVAAPPSTDLERVERDPLGLAAAAGAGTPSRAAMGGSLRSSRATVRPPARDTGVERPRRVVTIAAAGFWRWRFRGGRSADAYDCAVG